VGKEADPRGWKLLDLIVLESENRFNRECLYSRAIAHTPQDKLDRTAILILTSGAVLARLRRASTAPEM
jgi:hypothetical protein